MKNIIKIFVATAIMGVMTVSAFAQGAGPAGGAKGGAAAGPGGRQGGPGGGMRRGGRMQFDTEILAKLKLTADQQKKVKALKEATQKKGEELRKSLMGNAKPGANGAKPGGPGGPGGGRIQMTPELREKFKAIQDGYLKGLKGILTPTQYSDYEKQMKDLMAKMRAKGPGGPGGAPGKGGPGAPPGKSGGKGKGTIKP